MTIAATKLLTAVSSRIPAHAHGINTVDNDVPHSSGDCRSKEKKCSVQCHEINAFNVKPSSREGISLKCQNHCASLNFKLRVFARTSCSYAL